MRLEEERACFLMGFFRTDKPTSVCWQKVKQRLRQAARQERGGLMEQVLEGDRKF